MIIVISLFLMKIISSIVCFNKLNILKIKMIGEILLFLGITLTFVVNTNILGEFQSNGFVVEEYLKDIDMRIDRLRLDMSSHHHLDDSQSAVNTIYSLEKQVEYSDKQVRTSNTISGTISFVGAAFVLAGKFGEIKVEADREGRN